MFRFSGDGLVDTVLKQPWEWVKPPVGDVRFANGGGGYLRLQNVTRRPCDAACAAARRAAQQERASKTRASAVLGNSELCAPAAQKDAVTDEMDALLQLDLEDDDDPTSLAANPAL